MLRDKELSEALAALEAQAELAEVDFAATDEELAAVKGVNRQQCITDYEGIAQASKQPVFSENHIFTFDKLYMKAKDVLRIRKEGKVEILEDVTIRKPVYNDSATLAFPHLYPNGEMSP